MAVLAETWIVELELNERIEVWRIGLNGTWKVEMTEARGVELAEAWKIDAWRVAVEARETELART